MDTLKEILSKMDGFTKFEIASCEYFDNENYNVVIYTDFDGDSYSDCCDRWTKQFGAVTQTNWFVRTSKPYPVRFLYKKSFVCHHNGISKKERTGIKQCTANIEVTVLKNTKNTRKSNQYIKKGLPVKIQVDFRHNHRTQSANTLSVLRITDETRDKFTYYFEQGGMTPPNARKFHELMLLATLKDGADPEAVLSSTAVNPRSRQITYMHGMWRKEKPAGWESRTFLDIIKEKQNFYTVLGIEICVKENPTVVALLTPIMRRAHSVRQAEEVCYVLSGGTSDDRASVVTFLFSCTKIGAVPLAVVFHTARTEEDYSRAFYTLREVLTSQSFSGRGQPQIFITDDCPAQRNALTSIFPYSMMFLNSHRVTESLWTWLCEPKNKINKIDAPVLMRLFNDILRAESEAECQQKINVLGYSELAHKYPQFVHHFSTFFERMNEWCLCRRYMYSVKGFDTNDVVESSIRTFKDFILEKCWDMSACAVFEFVITTLEKYLRTRLLKYAGGAASKPEVIYQCFVTGLKRLVISKDENDVHCYLVTSALDAASTCRVYADVDKCDCIKGVTGIYCKHVCLVHLKYADLYQRRRPLLQYEDREDLAKIGAGSNFPKGFFIYEDVEDTMIIEPSRENGLPIFEVFDPCAVTVEDEAKNKKADSVKRLGECFERLVEAVKLCDAALIDRLSNVLNVDTPEEVESLVYYDFG